MIVNKFKAFCGQWFQHLLQIHIFQVFIIGAIATSSHSFSLSSTKSKSSQVLSSLTTATNTIIGSGFLERALAVLYQVERALAVLYQVYAWTGPSHAYL